tara:strand:- start:8049 stop:8867 length:819 start_codon:yes stop_codon:yes gene_type:complete
MISANGIAPPALAFRDLSVTYCGNSSETLALDSFSAEIFPGKIFALVGESGSGKSSAGFAAGGLLPASNTRITGEISIENSPISASDASALQKKCGRQIGFVFQEPSTALHPAIRIQTQVAESIHSSLSHSQKRDRVAELLRSVQLTPDARLLKAYPHHLSGGMQQRVVIAMAMANQPSVLIADEPTTALDPTIRKEILELIRSLAVQHRSGVLLITHDFGIVSHFADEVAVLLRGKVVESGSTQEILSSPSHPYTQTLIASARGTANISHP